MLKGSEVMDDCDYHIEGIDIDDPVVSIVLPTFNSSRTINKSIDSMINQSFKKWELIVINDYGSDDGTADIVRDYINKDSRVKMIQSHTRIGLADSLNLGIRLSKGKYIARMDSDDFSLPKRLEKQLKLMENDESIGICGTWQLHTGVDEWVHKAAKNDEKCRAHLLFWCDLCHSTLMLRKDVFISNNLFYDNNYKAEDFELWTRAMRVTRITNIPKVLGVYSETGGITNAKLDELSHENGLIVSNNLRYYFDIKLSDDEKHLFDQWNYSLRNDENKDEKLSNLERILRDISIKNDERKAFGKRELLESIANVWYKSKYDSNIGDRIIFAPKNIDQVFDDSYISSRIVKYRVYSRNNTGIAARIKGFFKIIIAP